MWLKRCVALVIAALIGVATSSSARAVGEPSRDAWLRAEIQSLVNVDGVPGVAAVTSHDRQPVRRMAAGLADIPADRAIRPNDQFRIASITKTFVATVVLQLVTEHQLALDQPIAGLLPEPVPHADQITVRELLNHTSGLYDYSETPHFDPGATYTPAQLIALGVEHSPYFTPGSGFRYSSTNYIVLGEIVHQVTGHAIQDEVQTRLIHALHLSSTTFPTTTMVAPRQARGYVFAAPLPPRSRSRTRRDHPDKRQRGRGGGSDGVDRRQRRTVSWSAARRGTLLAAPAYRDEAAHARSRCVLRRCRYPRPQLRPRPDDRMDSVRNGLRLFGRHRRVHLKRDATRPSPGRAAHEH